MALAQPSTPLKLADGRLVYPDGSIVDPAEEKEAALIEIPTNTEATQLVMSVRRKLSDLPDVPRTMNTVSIVLAYSLFGLDNVEIALATKMTENQVGEVKMSEPYAAMYGTVVNGILTSESDRVRDLFQQHSRKSVDVMYRALTGDKKIADKQITVARDFLDRAGHRPADVVEHRHKLEGGLVIQVIRKEKNEMPTIDLDVGDYNDSET